MLSERQRNITVELPLDGRTADHTHIADRFGFSISAIRRNKTRYTKLGRWQRLSGIGPSKATARNGRYLGRLVKCIRFHALAQDTQELATHLGHPVSKRTIQRMLRGQAIYSRVAVQKRT